MSQEKPTGIRRIVAATFVILLMICGFLLVGYAIHFFLLIFGAILFAVMLRAGTNLLKDKIKMPDGLALGITTLLYFGIMAVIIGFIVPTVADQTEDIRESIPESLENLKSSVQEYRWGQQLVEKIEEEGGDIIPDNSELVNRASGLFSSTLGVISDFFILLVIGVFFAASPQMYHQGIVVLAAPRQRERLSEVMDKLYFVLKSWLFGKFLTMLFVGIVSLIGLSILGVPMAVALAFIAFLLDFIPTIGPILAAVPAILVAFLEGPSTALWVAGIYFVIQSVESYVLVPIIYKKTVSISPVMTLGSLVLFGILAGPLGIILATPLIAVLQIIVKELYIKDFLEKYISDDDSNSFDKRFEKL